MNKSKVFDFLKVFSIFLLVDTFVGILVGIYSGISKTEFNMLNYKIIFTVLFSIIIYFYVKKTNPNLLDFNKKISLTTYLKVSIVVFITIIVLSYIIKTFDINIHNQKILEEMLTNANFSLSKNIFKILIFTLVPFFEEIIFRGYTFPIFNNKYYASFVSATFFSFAHVPKNFLSFIVYFSLGMLFSLVYLKTKSLKMSIYAHALNNFISVIFI